MSETASPASAGAGPAPGRSRWRWHAAALASFAAAAALVFADVWREGANRAVPSVEMDPTWALMTRNDIVFEAWLVARHAHTILRRPWRLFDTEHCAPNEKTLTLGVPMLTLGLLAVPASLVGNPIFAYNGALVLSLLIAALAMYCLVTDWTGFPPAGIAAGLLYAFHRQRLDTIFHPAEFDTTWTVLALFFARRLFAGGRWRDALGLALAGALQIAASFYPMLASLCLALPFAVWLALAYGFRQVKPAQLAFVALSVGLGAAAVLGPYSEVRAASPTSLRAAFQTYAPWHAYLAGGQFFPGFTLTALALVGCALPRRLGLAGLARDPRLALVAGALLVAIVAAGPLGNSVLDGVAGAELDPYATLAAIVPGLDSVRGVFRLAAGVHLVLAILAGAALAGCARLAGRHAALAGAALAAFVALAAFGPTGAGGERRSPWRIEDIHPHAGDLEYFAELERIGNRGPLFELPLPGDRVNDPAEWILLSAWHGRRTSACFGSFQPSDRKRLAELAEELPEPHAVRELAALGFTTIVVHDPFRSGVGWATRLLRPTSREGAWLRPLRGTGRAKAFTIELGPE